MDNGWFSGLALFIYDCVFIAIVVAWAEIFLKAGYNRWLCLLMFVPIVNVITFFWFAFSKWPINEFVSRDWRRKLLEDKKAKLEREISSLTDSSATKENPIEISEEKEIDTEELNDEKELKETEIQNDRLLTYAILGILLAILIGLAVYALGSC